MRREIKWPVIFLLLLTNCSPGNEVVMPFRNLAYSVDRLLPLKTSSSDFSFRIWISNSTSIYRVISISRDTVYDYSKKVIVAKDSSFEFNGYLTEIGRLHKGKKSKEYYKQIEIEPKSGYAEFKNEIH